MTSIRAGWRIPRAAVAISLSAVVSGACAQQMHYAPPAINVSGDAFKEDPNWKPTEPRDAAIRGQWWELLGDPQLDSLEAQVDVSNQTLKAVDARFAEARAVVRQTRAGLYPQVTAVPSVVGAKPSGTRAISSFHSAYGDILLPGDVSYEVDVWGRIHGTVTASVASAQASAADLESARLSLHAELAADYFALRGVERDRALLDEAVAAYGRALELAQNRFAGGLVSGADVAQAEAQLETTRAQSIDLQLQRAALEHAIALLVGQPAFSFSLTVAPLTSDAPPAIPGAVPSMLLERRPDIAATERRLAAASAQVGVANAALYPVVTLSGAAGLESSSLTRLLQGASGFWTAGPAVLATVLDGGRRKAIVAERRAQYDESAAVYQETVLSAFRETEDQLAALRILESEATVQDQALAAAQRALTLATNRYRGGVATYLEVIVAQNAALASERIASNIATRRMSATVLLLKALGGGWDASSLNSIALAQHTP